MVIHLTKKQGYILSIVIGIVLFIVSLTINMVWLYYEDTIVIHCENGTTETYNKTQLADVEKLCGGWNQYKYNDNSGLGAYFPNNLVQDPNQQSIYNNNDMYKYD